MVGIHAGRTLPAQIVDLYVHKALPIQIITQATIDGLRVLVWDKAEVYLGPGFGRKDRLGAAALPAAIQAADGERRLEDRPALVLQAGRLRPAQEAAFRQAELLAEVGLRGRERVQQLQVAQAGRSGRIVVA